MNRKERLNDYVAAIDAEKAAWRAVEGRLPGTVTFRIDLWLRWRATARWRDAVAQANSVIDRMCLRPSTQREHRMSR